MSGSFNANRYVAPLPTVVYKIGGSLLDLPDLPLRLHRVVVPDAKLRPLFVVGGGPATDLVRTWDRVHRLGEERSHWLALNSLKLTEALLAELLPDARIVKSREEACDTWSSGGWPILCTHDFLTAEEDSAAGVFQAAPLPHTWDVTSDSIAAWITLCWPAQRLVLLKSTAPPAGFPERQGNHADTVDVHFAELAPRLPEIEWVNLRADDSIAENRTSTFPQTPSPT